MIPINGDMAVVSFEGKKQVCVIAGSSFSGGTQCDPEITLRYIYWVVDPDNKYHIRVAHGLLTDDHFVRVVPKSGWDGSIARLTPEGVDPA